MTDYDAIDKAFNAWKTSRSAPDSVGPEWFTAAQYGKRHSISDSTSRSHIRHLIDAGTVESKTFKIQMGERVVAIPHYRLCKKKKTD